MISFSREVTSTGVADMAHWKYRVLMNNVGEPSLQAARYDSRYFCCVTYLVLRAAEVLPPVAPPLLAVDRRLFLVTVLLVTQELLVPVVPAPSRPC